MPKSAVVFTPAALTFLRKLKANNRREWFQPRKDQFDELLRQPLVALCEQVSDDLRSFAVEHVTPAAKAARRIYRDVRFSKDKTPYQTNVYALFPRAGLGTDAAAVFYFGVSPEELRIAVGLFRAGTPELAAVRANIANDPAGFTKLVTAKPLARLFGPCKGERLAKVPKDFPLDHPAAELLRQKQWYFATALDPSVATKPGLRKAIVDRFKAATPFANRLNETILAAVHDETGDGRPVRPEPMF
jgi:uncharacterized protein (TIGR02453 family)